MHYIFSSSAGFEAERTAAGSFYLAVLAAEIKVNYDKTMFQECAGTAARLKQGCPIAKYYALVEYLDMEPEDCRLTEIDNVFLLRKTKRLPYGKREDYNEVRRLHEQFPIDAEIVLEIRARNTEFCECCVVRSTSCSETRLFHLTQSADESNLPNTARRTRSKP